MFGKGDLYPIQRPLEKISEALERIAAALEKIAGSGGINTAAPPDERDPTAPQRPAAPVRGRLWPPPPADRDRG